MLKALKALFRSTKENCIQIYNEAKDKKPNKTERDYLKMVLLSKPPFDFQVDKLIDYILDECNTIEKLADHIETFHRDKNLWENRERNLRTVKENLDRRNKSFFEKFWL